MDELKEIADSAGDNYFGDVFIQLRHYLAIHEPGLLTDDDRQFRSPIRGQGITNHDHGNRHHENVWEVKCLFLFSYETLMASFTNSQSCSMLYAVKAFFKNL